MIDRISHYRILTRIGAGGMGEVYRAVDERLGRDVALKLLKAYGSSAERQLRLLREAQAASALNHPGIVTIYDVGTHDGRPYLVMELVAGKRFSDLATGALPVAEALAVCAQAADALAAAHGRGILHRDVKSDNLMRLPDGRVKVLDFGLAKLHDLGSSSSDVRPPGGGAAATAADPLGQTMAPGGHGWPLASDAVAETLPSSEPSLAADAAGAALRSPITRPESALTRVGDVIGTPAYMAPEQARALPALPQSEVWALAVVLYELLVGRRPFAGATVAETLELVKTAAPMAPSAASGRPLPRGVDALVLRALAKDPGERFPDMIAFAAALRAEASALDPRRRRRVVLAIAASVVVAGTAVAVIATVSGRTRQAAGPAAPLLIPGVGPPIAITTPLRPADVRRLTLADGCEEFPTFTPDGRTVIYDAAVGANYNLFATDTSSGAVRRLTETDGWEIAPVISPDGRSLAFLRKEDGRWAAYLTDVSATAPVRKIADGRMRPFWAPDSSALWAGDAARPTRMDVATGAPGRTLVPPAGNLVMHGRELPDGRVVGLLFPAEARSLGNGLVLFRADGTVDRWLFQEEVEEVLALSAAGDAVITVRVTTANDLELWWIPLDGSPPALVPGSEVVPRKGLAVAPDGRLAWSTCSTHIGLAAVVSSASGDRLVDLPGGSWADVAPTPIPGTTQLVVLTDRAGAIQAWIVDRKQIVPPRVVPLGGPEVEPMSFAVSHDGKLLAFTAVDQGLYVVPLDGSAAPRRVYETTADVAPAFSRDDRRIYLEQPVSEGVTRIASVPVEGGAPPTGVLPAGTSAPAASPVDDALLYVANEVPMLLDPKRDGGKPRPLSPALAAGPWRSLRFSADGQRIALMRGDAELVEVDRVSGRVLRRLQGGADVLMDVAYLGDELILSRQQWQGDIWIARDATVAARR